MTCLIAAGPHRRVRWAVRPGGALAAAAEWAALDPLLQVRFQVMFEWMAETGPIRNEDRWRALAQADDLQAFFAGDAAVIACTRAGETILLAVATVKDDEIAAEAVDQARLVRHEDLGGHP